MALEFNGSTSQLSTGNVTGPGLQGAGTFTIVTAVKAATSATGADEAVWQWGTAADGYVRLKYRSGAFTLEKSGGTGTIPTHTITQAVIAAGAAGEWEILVLWYDGTTFKVYGRGRELASSAGTFTLPTNTVDVPLTIGAANGSLHFDGRIAWLAGTTQAQPLNWIKQMMLGVFPDNYAGWDFCYGLWGHGSYPDLGSAGFDITTDTATTQVDDEAPSRIPLQLGPRGSSPTWLLKFKHGTYPFSVANDEVGGDTMDALMVGEAYKAGILTNPGDPTGGFRVRRGVPAAGGSVYFTASGVKVASELVNNSTSAADWKGVEVEARIYDPLTRVLQFSFAGRVGRAILGPEECQFTLVSNSPGLQLECPQLTLERVPDEGSPTGVVDSADVTNRPVDTGPRAPIPVVCGVGGLCRGRYVGEYTAGERFIFAYGEDAQFVRSYHELNQGKAGEESLTFWFTPPGDLTRISDTVLDVGTQDLSDQYKAGRLMRYTTDAVPTEASVWRAASIVSYDGATEQVTLSAGILDAAFTGTLQMANDIQRDATIWEDQVAGVKQDGIVTGTWLGKPGSRPICVMDEGVGTSESKANPGDFFYHLLTNTRWGLGQSQVSTAHRDRAVSDWAAAGLGSAMEYVLAGDGERLTLQRICQLLGFMRRQVTWQGPDGEWRWVIDSDNDWSAEGFGYNDGVFENLTSRPIFAGRPLSESYSKLRLWYEPGGEALAGRLEGEQFASYAEYGTGSAGSILERALPFVRTDSLAGRCVYHGGKLLDQQDETVGFNTGPDGVGIPLLRRVVVTATGGRTQTLTAEVVEVEEDLGGARVVALGPWNVDRYTYDAGQVTLPFAGRNPGERDDRGQEAVNLLDNPTWQAAPLLDAPIPVTSLDEFLPGWSITFTGTAPTVKVVSDPEARGRRYLEIVTAAGTANLAITQPFAKYWRPDPGIPISSPAPVVGSFYGEIAAGGSTSLQQDLAIELIWYDSTGSAIGFQTPFVLTELTSDVNGKGWSRWFGAMSPQLEAGLPLTDPPAAQMGFTFRFKTASTTYRLEWPQLEWLSSVLVRPTPPMLGQGDGVQPSQMLAGLQTQRVETTAQQSMVWGAPAPAAGETSLSGASVTLFTLTEDSTILGIGLNVSTNIVLSAGTTWDIRANSTTGPFIARGLTLTAGDQFAKPHFEGPKTWATGTTILAVPTSSGATFTSGGIEKVSLFRQTFTPAEV